MNELSNSNNEIQGEFEKDETIIWDSLALREVPVEIEKEPYVLVEASAEDAKRWRANSLQSLQMREKGLGNNRESMSSFTSSLADSHLLLVSLCLFKVGNGNRTPVDKSTIAKWPNRLVETLFKTAQRISGLLDEGEQEPGKNSTPGAALPAP